MEIAVHGRHVEVSGEVRELAERKVAHLGRYLSALERAEVCFSNGRPGRLGDPCTCEMVVEGGGHVIRVHGSGARQSDALDEALERGMLRARRLKDKLVHRSRPRHGTGSQKIERLGPTAGDLEGIGGDLEGIGGSSGRSDRAEAAGPEGIGGSSGRAEAAGPEGIGGS